MAESQDVEPSPFAAVVDAIESSDAGAIDVEDEALMSLDTPMLELAWALIGQTARERGLDLTTTRIPERYVTRITWQRGPLVEE